MKIKKYVARTASEAMAKVKLELGDNAVILNTRNIRPKGIFKYFKPSQVEVTAAYEEVKTKKVEGLDPYKDQFKDLTREILELKSIIERETKVSQKLDLPVSLEPFYKRMVINGVDSNIARRLLEDIDQNLDIESQLDGKIRETIGDVEPITIKDNKQKVVFFVGPTGVGKTTTLAKIAASLVLEGDYSIGLLTSDTYRIGAVDQLKIYADILKLPLHISYNQEEVIKGLESFQDKDIVLVDTAGRSHTNTEQINQLEEIVNSTEEKEVYLLLSGSMDIKVIESILQRYSFLEDYKLIVTKLDEVSSWGNLLNISYISGKPLSYFTKGQSVPEDIGIVDIDLLIDKIIKENYNE